MTGLDLRPLTLGEILDRTFTVYRRNFGLFIGIGGLPRLLMLAVALAQIPMGIATTSTLAGMFTPNRIALTLINILVALITYLFSQGGTIIAVSELYLGRQISVSEALRRVWSSFGFLFGVVILNALAVGGAMILLIIPGIYVGCRLLVCVPAALIEETSPRESLSRSWNLTQGFAGRSFMIFLFYVAIAIAAGLLFTAPFTVGMIANMRDPSVSRIWLALNQISSTIGTILVTPVLLIAISIFYFDLRVRKEAFDLQLMMDPAGAAPSAPGTVPSIL